MKTIYIAGKFRGANAWEIHQNVLRAEAATARLIGLGYAVICPHKITENMQGLYSDETYLAMCIELLRHSDCIYVLKDWIQSKGTLSEIREATKGNKEVWYEELEPED